MSAACKRMLDKVAVITGAASGIGASTAELFVSNGAKVVIADIQDEMGKALTRKLGENAEYTHCDVTKEEDVEAAVQLTLSKYGQLDVMFNNAGIIGRRPLETFPDLDISDLDAVYSTNVRGAVLGVKHAARVMIPAKTKGSILCTASSVSVVGCGSVNAYTISKHAVLGIVRAAATALGPFGIRVNAISPYAIPTPLCASLFGSRTAKELEESFQRHSVLQGVTLQAADIANAALFLASEEGRFISGHNLHVDGGHTASVKMVHVQDDSAGASQSEDDTRQ
eukprot:c9281_g1_i1 orf=351-1196(-)